MLEGLKTAKNEYFPAGKVYLTSNPKYWKDEKKWAGCLIKGRLARNLNHKKKWKSKQLHSVAAFYNLKWISD